MAPDEKEIVLLGRWSEEGINRILHEASRIKGQGERIGFLSGKFIGTNYREHTLVGDAKAPEVLVINLEGVDCFTFIDYIEAMRLSGSFDEFKVNLKKVRYKSGLVGFENRNHFFSDWAEFNSGFVEDVTEKVGGKKTQESRKMLNLKEDRTCFLPGIKPKKRAVRYIPGGDIDEYVLGRLRTGDYAGVYSISAGLDVSHAGIFIRSNNSMSLRHASSKSGKVTDEDFKDYMAGRPGLIVLRPGEPPPPKPVAKNIVALMSKGSG